MHQRTIIRKAIVDVLKDETSAAGRVYSSRVLPLEEDPELPCILVYSNKESVSIYQESPLEYERALSISVEIQAKADENLDDALDGIAEDVEHALCQDHTLEEMCADVILKDTDLTLTQNGDTLIGAAILTYEVTYYSSATADATEENHVNDLETVDVKLINPSDEAELSEDEIDLTEGD